MSNDIVTRVEQNQITRKLLCFRSGDSVIVRIWVFEGDKKRLQVFDGIVISIRKRGLNSTFTVRKYSYGEGVERIFLLHSPVIKDIVVKRRGKVHQSKLYYLRHCSGKHARIKERI